MTAADTLLCAGLQDKLLVQPASRRDGKGVVYALVMLVDTAQSVQHRLNMHFE